MTERKQIRLAGGCEATLVGAGSATAELEAALEAARTALGSQAEPRLAPPAAIGAASIGAKAGVVWSPVPAAVAYQVLRPATADAARYPEDAKYVTSEVSFLDEAVELGATYFYAVAAENSARELSSPSEIVSVSITAPAPGMRSSEPGWKPHPLPPVLLDWKPSIGAPAWGNLDVAEVSLETPFDVRASGLRSFVIASLDDKMPCRSGLTEALEKVKRDGHHRPYVGLSLDRSAFGHGAALRPGLVYELGGLANDLQHFGVGLAIRVDQ
jgi:hypothetical protein